MNIPSLEDSMPQKILWQTGRTPLALRELAIEPDRTALLIVDMQRYFDQGKSVVANVRHLLAFCRAEALPVIFLKGGSFLADARDQHAKRREKWGRDEDAASPVRCVIGSPECDIRADLAPLPGESVVNKNSTGAFNSSSLDHLLRGLAVQNLIVAGAATHHCVDTTVRDAADRGYNVILISDACEDASVVDHRTTLDAFARHFGSVRNTTEVINVFRRLLSENRNEGVAET